MISLKLALRNLSRNRIRTILNLCMVIGAFLAIILSRGFSNYTLRQFETSFTHGQSGHIMIAKETIWDGELPKNVEDAYLLDSETLIKKITQIPEVLHASGRTNNYALIYNRNTSARVEMIGFDPATETNLEETLRRTEGQPLSKDAEFEVLVSTGVQKQLQVVVGDNLTIVTQNLAGATSSQDFEVKGIVSAGMADLDNSYIYIPLKGVQRLLDTKGVQKIVVLLKDGAVLQTATDEVQAAVTSAPDAKSVGGHVLTKNWRETATVYRQVTNFFMFQNLFVEIILAVLVFFGILNTLGMSIYERIGEIGTMRALGDQPGEILKMFLLESLLLGIIGSLIAIPVAYLLAHGFNAAEISIQLPGASRSDIARIEPQLIDVTEAVLIVSITCLVSGIGPSLRALKMSIVDALRANS